MLTIDYKRLDIQSGDRILDIGCGPGRHVCGACAAYHATVIGADLKRADLREARTHLWLHEQYGGKLRGQWALCLSDITALPFSDAHFDHVICAEVMEHIPAELPATRELVRVLKPGGNLAVSVPRYMPEKICWWLSRQYANSEGGHIRIYKKSRIIGLFENRGLTKQGDHYAHSLHTPYWWLKCLFGPDNDTAAPVCAYHRFLTWDIMKKPALTRFMDRLFNPVFGKSLVLYFRK